MTEFPQDHRQRGAPPWAAIAAVILTLIAAAGCGSSQEDSQPRLVLIYATCSLNKDYIGPYNPGVSYTPNLDAFARESRVFSRHHTETGASGIAYASIYTGAQAPHHGVFYHPSRIAPEIHMLSEAFADAGYDTFFWDFHEMARRDLDYAQGVPPGQTFQEMLTARSKEFQAILQRLRSDPGYRVLILHNNPVPHSPYADADALRSFARDFPDALRDEDLREADRLLQLYRDHHISLQFSFDDTVAELGLDDAGIRQLARILDAAYQAQVHVLDRLFGEVWVEIENAGLASDSLVLFTSDHGELMYRDSALFKWAHGMQLTHEVINVPLILRGSRIRPGKYEAVTRTIDVFPTLAGLTGIAVSDDAGVTGVDLSPALVGDQPEPHLLAWSHTEFVPSSQAGQNAVADSRYAFVATLFPGYGPETTWVSVRDGDLLFKLRALDGDKRVLQAFDLARDPDESIDVFDPEDPAHREIAGRLRDYKARLVEAFVEYENEQAAELSIPEEERLRKLRALGYVD